MKVIKDPRPKPPSSSWARIVGHGPVEKREERIDDAAGSATIVEAVRLAGGKVDRDQVAVFGAVEITGNGCRGRRNLAQATGDSLPVDAARIEPRVMLNDEAILTDTDEILKVSHIHKRGPLDTSCRANHGGHGN